MRSPARASSELSRQRDPLSTGRESGRGDRIRTCDLLVPNQALYQAKLRPDADAPDYAENVGSGKRFRGRRAGHGLGAVFSVRAMQILVNRQGQQLGPFTIEQLRAELAAGNVGSQDLAWWEGAPAWVAVSAVPGISAAAPAAGDGSGLAVWSLILGLLSVFGCLFFSGIPAVICGHMALARKERAGVKTGKGLAITGLVTGYFGTIMMPVIVAVLASIALPAFSTVREKAKATQSLNHVRQIAIGLVMYANAHDDTFPPTLDELEDDNVVSSLTLTDPLAPEFGNTGYIYTPPAKDDPEDKVILMSRGKAKRGERAVGRKDGSARLEKFSLPADL